MLRGPSITVFHVFRVWIVFNVYNLCWKHSFVSKWWLPGFIVCLANQHTLTSLIVPSVGLDPSLKEEQILQKMFLGLKSVLPVVQTHKKRELPAIVQNTLMIISYGKTHFGKALCLFSVRKLSHVLWKT